MSELPKPHDEDSLYLVDLSSFIFRAFYAIRPLHAPSGEPVNAVYGVATMLARIIEEAKPLHLILTRDSKEESFRSEIYSEYKANRTEPPEDLIPQFGRIEEMIRAFGFPEAKLPGYEADDLIATLTKRWLKHGPKKKVVIISNDKDLMALASDRVVLWDTLNDKVSGPKEVLEKFGVTPLQIQDYLSIVGDSSDNVPGIKGLGPKAAVALLEEWKNLEGIITASKQGKIPGRRGELLASGEKIALLSKKLVTLHEDVPFEQGWEDSKFVFRLGAKAQAFLAEMGFRSLLEKWAKLKDEVPGEVAVSGDSPAVFETIKTEKEFHALLSQMEKRGEFGFDLETNSLNPREAKIVGISICTEKERAFYIPIGHRDAPFEQLSEKKVLSALKAFLENPKFKKIGQNLKYDFSVLMEQGWKPDGIGADTMVASYVLDPTGRHNLELIASRYLNHQVMTFEQVCGKGKNQITFDQVPVDLATKYSAEDAWCAIALWEKLQPELQKEGLMEVFATVDLPLVQVLARMETKGVAIDLKRLEELKVEFQAELANMEKAIFKYSKEPINLNSPKQVADLLFEKLKLPPQTRTKTGLSTDASVLSALSHLHEVPKLLLEYREISKLLGTYVEPLPLLQDPKTGRIHAGFHQTGTATGRLSSSDPNLQNIPIRSDRGFKIRSAFVAEKGKTFLSADYSQIELRILAHLSGDKELSRSFLENEDVHQRTAAEIFGISLKAVTDKERGVAKAINFGLMYGKTAFGLSQELGISRAEAKGFIDRYFERYAGVKKFLDQKIEEARERGFTTTLLGRKRKVPDIRSQNQNIRGIAERIAMNTPIQGTAADMIKIAMAKLDQELQDQGLSSRLIIQVHDELLLECPESEVKEAEVILKKTMQEAMPLSVPLSVNVGKGKSWDQL